MLVVVIVECIAHSSNHINQFVLIRSIGSLHLILIELIFVHE